MYWTNEESGSIANRARDVLVSRAYGVVLGPLTFLSKEYWVMLFGCEAELSPGSMHPHVLNCDVLNLAEHRAHLLHGYAHA
jgi:hypothetical protein